MERPERTAALEYLRRHGTDAPAARLCASLRAVFHALERKLVDVPEAMRTLRPAPDAWSVHEVVDHLVESDRPAVAELRDLCAGMSPVGGPIRARLQSPDPFARSWPELVRDLTRAHADLLASVASADDDTPLTARAPSVIVITVPGESGREVLEWVEQLDWKAYTQAIRVHTHEHLAQIERTIAALPSVASRKSY
jgi:DinB family protein